MKPVVKAIEIKSGFFPSLVYLATPPSLHQEPCIQQVLQILAANNIQYQPVEQLHISLTKTFYPIESEIPRTIASLKEILNNKLIRLPVVLLLHKIIIIDNFVAIEVTETTAAKLGPIAVEIAKIARQQFYEKPIFHISLCKVLSEVESGVLYKLMKVQVPRNRSFVLEKCLAKTGKVIHTLN